MLLRIGRVTKHLLTYPKNVETKHIACKLQEKLDCPVLDQKFDQSNPQITNPHLRKQIDKMSDT